MPTIKAKGTDITMDVAEGSPLLHDPKYELYTPVAPVNQMADTPDVKLPEGYAFQRDTGGGLKITTTGPSFTGNKEWDVSGKSADEISAMFPSVGTSGSIVPTDYSQGYDELFKSSDAYKNERLLADRAEKVNLAQQEFDVINAELKGIESRAKAEALNLENQNKAAGVNARVGSFLNREVQEINRQAAIEALPLQARALAAQANLRAAQGDETNAQNIYQMALKRFDKMFELKKDYEEKMAEYRNKQIEAAYDAADKSEQKQLDLLKEQNQTNLTLYRDKVADQQAIVKEAMTAGQADIAAQIGVLDVNSPTYANDLKNLQMQIIPEGYKYVSTPAERDRLRAEGYEIIERGGRTYAKPPEFTTKNIQVGSSEYIITYDKQGKEVKRELLRGGGGSGSGSRGGGSQLSGKYSEFYLQQRAADYINEDGTIDWIGVDELENTDKNLWNDVRIVLSQGLEEAQVEEVQAKDEINKKKEELVKSGKYYIDPTTGEVSMSGKTLTPAEQKQVNTEDLITTTEQSQRTLGEAISNSFFGKLFNL